MAGISVQEIMSRAGWSRKSTFCKHYYRPQSEESTSENFSKAILSQATNMQRTCWWAGALRSTIGEWLRLLGSWMLFPVVRGGRRWPKKAKLNFHGYIHSCNNFTNVCCVDNYTACITEKIVYQTKWVFPLWFKAPPKLLTGTASTKEHIPADPLTNGQFPIP